MGVLSMDELLLVLSLFPLDIGVDAFLGLDEPNPTGVWRSDDVLPPPDLMLEDRLTLPPLGESSELSDMLDPERDGIPLCLLPPYMPSSPASKEARVPPMGRLRSDFCLILVIGPETLGRCPCPEIELPGLDWARDLNGVIDWETPEARVNCSLSSTFVRPFARGW